MLSGCHRENEASPASRLTEEFVLGSLALSPISATAAGYHTHGNLDLDTLLDDYSPAGMEKSRQFYRSFEQRLNALNRSTLGLEDQVDIGIIANQIGLALQEFDEIQNWRHNPTLYVESAGNALFTPFMQNYAGKEQRYADIVARLEKLPAFLKQARENLQDAPEIWVRVAIAENRGNVELVQNIWDGASSQIKTRFDPAAEAALKELTAFQSFLEEDLLPRAKADWRLGAAKYDKKFRLVLALDRTPEATLSEAEADVKSVRARMLTIATELYPKYYPGKPVPPDANTAIRNVLDRIADRHSTPMRYMGDAQRDLEEAREFVRSHNLLPLPPRDNLLVIHTPEFMRGIYAVGGFNPAPPLEPQLGAYYWLTPIDTTWPQERIESKLREYNFYKLKLLTIHEAMPGHYVQFEYANDVQPKGRRVLRAVYGNGPYIEGWGQYATQIMLDEGYLDHSPELRMTFLKEELRVLANAILDIRLHTKGMTDEEALALMIKDTFQEREEATAKLQRAKLSSCQLPTYLVGWRGWLRVREQYRTAQGSSYQLSEFNRKALEEGAVPLPLLGRLLTGGSPGGTPSK